MRFFRSSQNDTSESPASVPPANYLKSNESVDTERTV